MVRSATPFQNSGTDDGPTERVEEPAVRGKQKQEQRHRNVRGSPTAEVVIGARRKRTTEHVDEHPPHDSARLGQGPPKRSKMSTHATVQPSE